VSEIGKSLAKWLFYFVAMVLLIWSSSLTYTFIAAALPALPWYVPFAALVAFDGGMMSWLFVFLKAAEGVIQRATALAVMVFDFLGVGLMVIAEILLGGQALAAVPENLGTYAIWGIGIWTVGNLGAVLLYHVGDPEAQKQMSVQNEKDAIWRGALADLATRRTKNSTALAAQLGDRLYQEMLAELFVDRDGDGRPDLLQSRNEDVAIPAAVPAPVAQPNRSQERPITSPLPTVVNGGNGTGPSGPNFQ